MKRRRRHEPVTTPGPLAASAGSGRGRIPLVHVTDLYHPPQDPDDHVDLATIAGLEEYDLRAVVLDVTRKFLVPAPAGWDAARDPGFVPVLQLGYLSGRAIPVAAGPMEPLGHPGDSAADRPVAEQGGIELLLRVLAQSEEAVVISVVGSCRVVAAAFNREPALLRARTRAVLLNAGATGGRKREWNVALDPAASVCLWRSGLPLCWFPCATGNGAFDRVHERSAHWKVSHELLFREIPAPLRAWFCHALSGNLRGDCIRALSDGGRGAVWEGILAGERCLWSTASLVMAAGRVLSKTSAGWRFVPAHAAAAPIWPWRLDGIHASVADHAGVRWRLAKRSPKAWLFGRRAGAAFGAAMGEALNALLRRFPC